MLKVESIKNNDFKKPREQSILTKFGLHQIFVISADFRNFYTFYHGISNLFIGGPRCDACFLAPEAIPEVFSLFLASDSVLKLYLFFSLEPCF